MSENQGTLQISKQISDVGGLNLEEFDFLEDLQRLRDIAKTFLIPPEQQLQKKLTFNDLNNDLNKKNNTHEKIDDIVNQQQGFLSSEIQNKDVSSQIDNAENQQQGFLSKEIQNKEVVSQEQEIKNDGKLNNYENKKSSVSVQNQQVLMDNQNFDKVDQIQTEKNGSNIDIQWQRPAPSLQLPPSYQIPQNKDTVNNNNNEDCKIEMKQNAISVSSVEKKSTEFQKNNVVFETQKLDPSSNLSYIMALQNRQIPSLPSMGLKRKDDDVFKKPPPKKFKSGEPGTSQPIIQTQFTSKPYQQQYQQQQQQQQQFSQQQQQQLNAQQNVFVQQNQQQLFEGLYDQEEGAEEDIYDSLEKNQIGNFQGEEGSGDFLNLYGGQNETLQDKNQLQTQQQQTSNLIYNNTTQNNEQNQSLPQNQVQQYMQFGQLHSQEQFLQQQQQQQQIQQLQQQQQQQQQQQKSAQQKGGVEVKFGLLSTLNEWKTSNPDKAYTVRHQQPFSGNKWQSSRPTSGTNQFLPVINPIQQPPQSSFQGGKPNNTGRQFPQQKHPKGKKGKTKKRGGGRGGGGGQHQGGGGQKQSSKGNIGGAKQRQHKRN